MLVDLGQGRESSKGKIRENKLIKDESNTEPYSSRKKKKFKKVYISQDTFVVNLDINGKKTKAIMQSQVSTPMIHIRQIPMDRTTILPCSAAMMDVIWS